MMKRFSLFLLTVLATWCTCYAGGEEGLTERMLSLIPGQEVPMNPNDPQYKLMAEETVRYYLRRVGATLRYQVISVERVTVERIDGIITRISYTAAPNYCLKDNVIHGQCPVDLSKTLVCNSKITELSGTSRTTLKVNCYPHS